MGLQGQQPHSAPIPSYPIGNAPSLEADAPMNQALRPLPGGISAPELIWKRWPPVSFLFLSPSYRRSVPRIGHWELWREEHLWERGRHAHPGLPAGQPGPAVTAHNPICPPKSPDQPGLAGLHLALSPHQHCVARTPFPWPRTRDALSSPHM